MVSRTFIKSLSLLSCCLATGYLDWGAGGQAVAWASSPSWSASVAAPSTGSQRPEPGTVVAQRTEAPTAWPVPPLPSRVPEAVAPHAAGLVGLYPDPQTDLGAGHLRPKDLSSLEGSNWLNSPILGANWLQGVALPIYARPADEQPWGWLLNGWLITGQSQPLAIGRDAAFSMLHTYYALHSFPVMEIRPDGWFRFQYTPAGTAWAHLSHLNLGAIDLTVETWEDRFLDAGWVEFRKHGLSRSLLPQPNSSGPIINLVGANSFIQPLQFEGDWMRVRVTQPMDACSPLPGAQSAEGWMRWRGSDRNSLIWFPPKGC